MSEYALSWSGGKDSCYSCWKALSQGLKVNCLLNFVITDSKRPLSHGLNPELIALQAKAMEIPIVQKTVTWETYEAGFKTVLQELKQEGITGLITGDIYLQEHKDWIEQTCSDVEVKPVLPLWNMSTLQLLNDFVEVGFKAVLVSVKTEFFGKEWLGRQLDNELILELSQYSKENNIDICGEAGEYHTFVYSGPLFQKSIEIGKTAISARDSLWCLDILDYSLT
jgi:uncharacterized protein (TIGR00290 family)